MNSKGQCKNPSEGKRVATGTRWWWGTGRREEAGTLERFLIGTEAWDALCKRNGEKESAEEG